MDSTIYLSVFYPFLCFLLQEYRTCIGKSGGVPVGLRLGNRRERNQPIGLPPRPALDNGSKAYIGLCLHIWLSAHRIVIQCLLLRLKSLHNRGGKEIALHHRVDFLCLYSTPITHILSGIITKATGMSTLDFAKQYLFDPLDIPDVGWDIDPLGYHRGGWGMYLTSRDMARFGYLYLNSGLVDGKQKDIPGRDGCQ